MRSDVPRYAAHSVSRLSVLDVQQHSRESAGRPGFSELRKGTCPPPQMMGLFLAAEPLLRLVYGPKMSPSVPVLRVAALIPLIRFISGGYGAILISIHRQEVQVIGAAVATVLIAALDWFLVPRAGYIAAAWVNLLANSVVLGIFVFVILKELRSTLMTLSLSALYRDTLALWTTGAQALKQGLSTSRRGTG